MMTRAFVAWRSSQKKRVAATGAIRLKIQGKDRHLRMATGVREYG